MAQARLSTANRRREMECAVCLDKLRHPKMLSCSHNFCNDCLEGLVQDQRISCPTCRKETTLGPGGVGDLPKNIALISIMESFCEQCLSRDQEVCCDHCGLWMCSQCHDSCKRELSITKQWNVFMKDLNKKEAQITEKKAQLTDTFVSIMDQIDATEGKMIKSIRLSAKRLREEVERELNQQLDVLDKMTVDINQLKTEILDFIKNRSKTEDTNIESLTDQWRDKLLSCQSEISKTNTKIEFIASETTPSVGEIAVRLNQEHTESTVPMTTIDYKNVQFEYATFGSHGSAPGQFNQATRVVISPVTRNFIVLDCSNNRIQLFSERHEFVLEFGSKGDREGQFNFDFLTAGLCVTDDGLIVVADAGNYRLQVFTERGEHVRSIGSNGSGPRQFDRPYGLAVQGDCIYVCDSMNHRIQVLELGGKFVRQFGSKDVFDNACPCDVTIHQNGDIYVVADKKLFVFTADGESKGAVNTDSLALQGVWGVTTDSAGNIIVSDYWVHNIHILTTTGKLLRSLGSEGHGPGQLRRPVGLVCSPDGRITVADCYNHRVQIFSMQDTIK